MAKVKRSVLKEIVKECLLEILFEGIDSSEPGYEEEEPIREARTQRRASRPSSSNTKKVKAPSRNQKGLREAPVQAAVQELTDDPMMAAIFADTAQTTLQEQKEGRTVPADNAAAAVGNVDNMEDLFAGAGDWAAIAFNES
jgi:hypothetical protein